MDINQHLFQYAKGKQKRLKSSYLWLLPLLPSRQWSFTNISLLHKTKKKKLPNLKGYSLCNFDSKQQIHPYNAVALQRMSLHHGSPVRRPSLQYLNKSVSELIRLIYSYVLNTVKFTCLLRWPHLHSPCGHFMCYYSAFVADVQYPLRSSIRLMDPSKGQWYHYRRTRQL